MTTIRELPKDEQLRDVGSALDPVMMRVHFQFLLLDDRGMAKQYRVAECCINHVRYRVGKKCVIGYVVSIEALDTGEQTDLHYAARVFPAGTSLRHFEKAESQTLVTPPFGPPLLHLPALDMVIWAFPNERKMSGIPLLMETTTLGNARLDEMVQLLCGAGWRISDSACELVHYVPEHTCTTRVSLTLKHATSATKDSLVLFGKCYYNDDGAETWRMMNQLWSHETHRQGWLRIAQPVAYDAQSRSLWQVGLLGETMLNYQGNHIYFTELVAEAAASVAHLHSTQLDCARTVKRTEWLQKLDAVCSLVQTVQPQQGPRVKALTKHLRNEAKRIDREPEATLHGDLHWQNFLVHDAQPAGQRIAMIDLDSLSSGSPWMDLGSFFAGLTYRTLLDNNQPSQDPLGQVKHLIDIFLVSYQAYAPWPLDQDAIAWYTAAALVNERVYRSISRLKPGRLALIETLLSVAEEHVSKIGVNQ